MSMALFAEVLGLALVACLLTFWAGWRSRDKEIERLEDERDSRSETLDRWIGRAMDAENELSKLPRRVPGGQFAKRA